MADYTYVANADAGATVTLDVRRNANRLARSMRADYREWTDRIRRERPRHVRITTTAENLTDPDCRSSTEVVEQFGPLLIATGLDAARVSLSPGAWNTIAAFVWQLNSLDADNARAGGENSKRFGRIMVVGAGMMGAGIAHVAARANMAVVLVDLDRARAERGKAHSATLMDRLIAGGEASERDKAELLERIETSDRVDRVSGCDLAMEAVFESIALKREMLCRLEPVLAPDGILATNTSGLPITRLAANLLDPSRLAGIHFSSPVHRMDFVEIVRGASTGPATLARAFDFANALGKRAICVRDHWGFYISRLYRTFLNEGLELLADGVHSERIEDLARRAGAPTGPLTQFDEVSLQLSLDADSAWRSALADDGEAEPPPSRPEIIVRDMCERFGRRGKAQSSGFYDYEGGEKRIWPGLASLYHRPEFRCPDIDVMDRLLYRQCVEAVRCVEDGTVDCAAAANLGALIAIGFPPLTGGPLQWINSIGLQRFAERCAVLADRYGERFRPPALLLRMAAEQRLFL